MKGVIGLPQLLYAGTPTEAYQVRTNTSVLMGKYPSFVTQSFFFSFQYFSLYSSRRDGLQERTFLLYILRFPNGCVLFSIFLVAKGLCFPNVYNNLDL